MKCRDLSAMSMVSRVLFIAAAVGAVRLRGPPSTLAALNQTVTRRGLDRKAFTPKDGFMAVACTPMSEENLGFNKTITRYNKPKEDMEPMTPQVCFGFCRSVPGSLFFGVANGRECFCSPWLITPHYDSSECDETCEGDPTQMCGGKSLSSMWEMHSCMDSTANLVEASNEFAAAEMEVRVAARTLSSLSATMQEQAQLLQDAFGRVGDPVASDLMQVAKVWAGRMEEETRKHEKHVDAMHEQAKKTLTFIAGNPKLKQAVDNVIFASADLDPNLNQYQMHANLAVEGGSNLTDAQIVEMEASTSGLKANARGAREATAKLETLRFKMSPGEMKEGDNPSERYYPLMYFVDKEKTNVPTTCGGDAVGHPIVGRSHNECAAACDAQGQACAGFSYFPSKLCFLFSKFRTATYFNECAGSDKSGSPGIVCSVKFSEFEGTTLKPDPSGKCKHCLTKATQADRCPNYAYRGVSYPELEVSDSAFARGTYRIQDPGIYRLTTDVLFNPITEGASEMAKHFPDPYSVEYPQAGGYFLGFFAAVAIEANGVTFDCQGHSIGMHDDFHKRQRFFSAFELGSKPFISGVGPPQFASTLLSSSPLVMANKVTIQNCTIGLSSHHGIHGNENHEVTITNTKIKDFEVGGVHLNGASKVVLEDIDVGPSLAVTFRSELSQALFLDHLMSTLILDESVLGQLMRITTITLRGETYKISEVMENLRKGLQTFLETDGGPLASLLAGPSGKGLPDGSAIYGIVLHKTGPAINDFGACPLFQAVERHQIEKNVRLHNVKIHDLAVKVDQWTRMVVDGNQVMGPAGDVFNFVKTTASGKYVGNLLSDAQLAVGKFKSLWAQTDYPFTKWYFGATHVPETVLSWAAGSQPWAAPSTFECFGDSMSHFNKGAVGLRVAYMEDVVLSNVHVSNIKNEGTIEADANLCSTAADYKGRDVRGVAIVNSNAVDKSGLEVDTATLVSSAGGASIPIDTITTF